MTILSLGYSAFAQESMLHLKSSTDAAGTLQNEVGLKFTKWSDATAIFRPSRWATPFKEGGFLSWLNPVAWKAAPGRTGLILAGEVVIIGAAVVGVDALSGGGGSSSKKSSGGGGGRSANINTPPASAGNGPAAGGATAPGGGGTPGGGSPSPSAP